LSFSVTIRGPQKYPILDDYASRQIASTLQRHEAPDTYIALDVHVGTDRAPPTDDGIAANEDEIPNPRILPDLDTFIDDAVLAVDAIHSMSPGTGAGMRR
jgi:hypothetical protein